MKSFKGLIAAILIFLSITACLETVSVTDSPTDTAPPIPEDNGVFQKEEEVEFDYPVIENASDLNESDAGVSFLSPLNAVQTLQYYQSEFTNRGCTLIKLDGDTVINRYRLIYTCSGIGRGSVNVLAVYLENHANGIGVFITRPGENYHGFDEPQINTIQEYLPYEDGFAYLTNSTVDELVTFLQENMQDQNCLWVDELVVGSTNVSLFYICPDGEQALTLSISVKGQDGSASVSSIVMPAESVPDSVFEAMLGRQADETNSESNFEVPLPDSLTDLQETPGGIQFITDINILELQGFYLLEMENLGCVQNSETGGMGENFSIASNYLCFDANDEISHIVTTVITEIETGAEVSITVDAEQ